MKSEPGVSDRAYPSRDCLPGGESEGEEVGSGRARGEQTGKSTASASASARVPPIVPSNALFKMSLAHVCQTNDLVGKSALAKKETDITSQTIARRPFYRRSFSLSLPSKDAHSKIYVSLFRLVLILFDK